MIPYDLVEDIEIEKYEDIEKEIKEIQWKK